MANLEAKGSLPPGVFPREYDPKFLSVFAMSVAKAQQGGMAAGGIASIAQSMKDQGRGKDTMLAHISPSEAKLLEERGGVNTINPVTGLPEFGIFDDIGNALSGVGKAVGSVLKPVGDLIGGVLSSPLGMAATAAAAYYFMGPGAGAVLPSVAEAALPGAAAAEIGTAAHLTPAAIEAGIGSAGYGFNQSAAASGLFDPATIGSGAAIGAPSTTDKLLSANLLKNVKLSPGEEEPASDPNALIKMLMMFEMMNNKQSQPGNAVVPALAENTSNLPYDAPKKPAYPQTRAAEGGLMTKHLGIGGLSANRTQTDYAKNYLPGSKYRPGQGGVTYFTPMKYGSNVPAPSLPVEPTPTPTPVDELVNQTIGRPGGGGGRADREPEDPNSFSAQWAAMSDAEKEAFRLENPKIAAAQDLAMLIGSPFAFAYKKIQELMGPDNSTGGPSRYTGPPVTPDFAAPTYGGYPEGYSPNPYSMGPGTPGFNAIPTGPTQGAFLPSAPTDETTAGTVAGSDMQRALDSLTQSPNSIAGSDMQRALDSVLSSTPTSKVSDLVKQLDSEFTGSDGLGSSYNLGPFTNSDLSGSPYNLGPFTAANTADTTAETISRINNSFEASEAANREAEAFAMERQTTIDRMARDAEAAEREAANQANLDADRAQADRLEKMLSVPLGEGTIAPAAPLGGVDLTGGISVPLGTGTSTPSGPDLTGGIASLGGGFAPSDNGNYSGSFGNVQAPGEAGRGSAPAPSSGESNPGDPGRGGGGANVPSPPMGANASPSDGGAPPSGGGGGGGGGGRVICTHFYRKGEMSREMWRSDLEFTFKNLSPTTVRGYQYWAIPYVKLMRKSKLAENIMRPLAMHRAQELAYQMGRSPKGSLFGKVVRLIGEPICFTVGLFVGEQNWQSLWTPAKD
jgi:hypothetical protein